MFAHFKDPQCAAQAALLPRQPGIPGTVPELWAGPGLERFCALHARLLAGGLPLRLEPDGLVVDGAAAGGPEPAFLAALARHGLLRFDSAEQGAALSLWPCAGAFDLRAAPPLGRGLWKASRFAYLHHHQGELHLRSANAGCHLSLQDGALAALFFQLGQPTRREAFILPQHLQSQERAIFGMLAMAGAILPCDGEQGCAEDSDPVLRQWDFHDMLFHSASRLGRTEKPVGGTYRFQGILEPQPTVKPNPWTREMLALAAPNLQALRFADMPLTAAIEGRRSVRSHSPTPLTVEQLGHFLYRTVRNRQPAAAGFTSRPYPCGGANYEQEIYVAVGACVGVRRGLHYYDPERHALCLVAEPCPDFEALLDEAHMATAHQCRPQILLTIASRFNRFNWKYTGMSYAAQLKNVGALYQTMYLVATSMRIGACALGLGNTERFSRLTGLGWLEEGSVGEFMLGRPLV